MNSRVKRQSIDKRLVATKKVADKVDHLGDSDYRMLADGYFVHNDTHRTRISNNDLICGGTGMNKTIGYINPLIRQMCGSMIISDTKDTLYELHGDYLRENGYKVYRLDIVTGRDSCAYNPLEYVKYDAETDTFNERDIVSLAKMLCNFNSEHDKFWNESAQILLTALISYILEATPFSDHHMNSIKKLFNLANNPSKLNAIMEELGTENPSSFAYNRFKTYKMVVQAEKTHACVLMFAANAINNFDCKETRNVFESRNDLKFEDIGKEKTAFFINMSDRDHSMDNIIGLLYRDLLDKLITYAESLPEKRLPVPVRFIMDDFSAGCRIEDFSKIISVIRSREISVSLVIQNISQLEEGYTKQEARTIIANCAHILFLGSSDNETIDYFSRKMNVPFNKIQNMTVEDAYLFEAGNPKGGMKVKKYYPPEIKASIEKYAKLVEKEQMSK